MARIDYDKLPDRKRACVSRAAWECMSEARRSIVASPDVELLAGTVEVRAKEKDGPAEFDMVAYTGVDFPRYWGRLVVDLDGITGDDTMAILREHDDRAPIGVCTSRKLEGEGDKRRLRLRGHMLSNPVAREVMANAAEGLPYKASIGVRILKTEELESDGEGEVNGRKLKGPLTIAKQSRLFETSFITCNPADLATSVEIAASAEAEFKEDRWMAKPNEAPGAKDATTERKPDETARVGTPVEVASAIEAAMATERGRNAAILGAFPKHPKFAARQVAAGATLAQAQAAFVAGVAEGKLKAGSTKKNKAGLDRLKERTNHPGLGFAGAERQGDAPAGAPADLALLSFEKRDEIFAGKLPSERAKIEVGRDNRLASIFRDYTFDVTARDPETNKEVSRRHAISGEKMYEKALEYERKLRRDGFSPLVAEEEVEACAKALRQVADPRFGPINAEKLATSLGTPTGGSWRKDGPDYSKVTVKGFLGAFWMRFELELAGIWAPELSFRVESNQETETHRFLGGAPQLSEWVDGVAEDGLQFFEIQQTNKLYQSAVSVDAQDWVHQKFGLITARFGEQGAIAAEHWNELFTIMLNTNANAYDGKSYFNTAHTFGGQSGSNTNDIAAADYPQLHVSDPTQPTLTEMANALMVAVPHMRRFIWNNGVPINGGAKRFAIMVPQAMEGVAFAATRTDRLNFGEGNPLFNQEFSYEVIPNPRLTMTTNTLTPIAGASKTIYIFRLDANTNKPAILQEPGPPQLLFQGPGSYREYMKNSYGFKIKSSRSLGPGAWESAVRVTFS